MKTLLSKIRSAIRARRIKINADDHYNTAVYSCARVSKANNNLCFVIRRAGIFGGPLIETIRRPEIVVLTESDNCLIIKDGKIYELVKRYDSKGNSN